MGEDGEHLARFLIIDVEPMPINPAWVRSMCEANGTICEFFDCESGATKLYSTPRVSVLLCDPHEELVTNPPRAKGYEGYLADHMRGLMLRKSWVYMNAVSDGRLEELLRETKLSEVQQGIKQRAKEKLLKKRIADDVKASGVKPGMPDPVIAKGRLPMGAEGRILASAFRVPPPRIIAPPPPSVPSAQIVETLPVSAPVDAPQQAGAPAAESADTFDMDDYLFN